MVFAMLSFKYGGSDLWRMVLFCKQHQEDMLFQIIVPFLRLYAHRLMLTVQKELEALPRSHSEHGLGINAETKHGGEYIVAPF